MLQHFQRAFDSLNFSPFDIHFYEINLMDSQPFEISIVPEIKVIVKNGLMENGAFYGP